MDNTEKIYTKWAIVYALSQNRRGMIINLLKGKTLNALLTFPKTLGPELSFIKIKKEQIMSVPSIVSLLWEAISFFSINFINQVQFS